MKRSLFLMGIATCLALSGLNVAAVQLTAAQSKLASELGGKMVSEYFESITPTHIEGPGFRIQRLVRPHGITAEEQVLDSFNKAFPEGFDSRIDPRTALELVNNFDTTVKAGIDLVIRISILSIDNLDRPSLAQSQQINQTYNHVLNSPAGQLYQALVESKKEELTKKIQHS